MKPKQQLLLVLGLMLIAIWKCWSSAPLLSPDSAEGKKKARIQTYLNSYGMMAVHEMHRSNVPASITLAQGILESAYGQSDLAVNAHNHFGIKCGKEWGGDKFCAYSNEWSQQQQAMVMRLSCFRKYSTVSQGFRDHSHFLTSRDRYAELFKLSRYDYINWAKGLQRCGYATDPEYASKLISLIERYQLYVYDNY